MMTMSDLAALRRDYSRRIMEKVGVQSPRLEAAYAAVPREEFVGPGPWSLFSFTGYSKTPDGNADHLYDDVLVALVPEKRINNGQPSGHAMWLNAAHPHPGEHVVHIGAGTGYYTAILAELVGPTGRITAIEYDAGLATKARANLAHYPNVTVIHGDGVSWPFDPADVIYVNAGVTRPADGWLDRLMEGGRLVLPLTASGEIPLGAMFCVEKRGGEFLARAISGAGFIPCEGLRDAETADALGKAFGAGGAERVSRLVRGENPPKEDVWFQGAGWALLYR
jgi:protein-L-isoaspartate(D-aspartate) O-methyltransferase